MRTWLFWGMGGALLPLLGFIFARDQRVCRIPNKAVAALFCLGLLSRLAEGSLSGESMTALLLSGIVGMVLAGLPLLIVSMIRFGAFGGGDLKLMAAAGMLLGAQKGLVAFAIGVFAAGAWLVCSGRVTAKHRKEEIPFGPFLCIGIAVAYFAGDRLVMF